jgi:hypothetical protein
MERRGFIELVGALFEPLWIKDEWVLCPLRCNPKIFAPNGSSKQWKERSVTLINSRGYPSEKSQLYLTPFGIGNPSRFWPNNHYWFGVYRLRPSPSVMVSKIKNRMKLI